MTFNLSSKYFQVKGVRLKNKVEVFYLNTIEQLFQCVEQQEQVEVCLACSRLPTGIPMHAGGIPKSKVEQQ